MIKRPEQLTFTDKTFSMILYGAPGTGKTTLALSAPDPILIDFDRGVDRVKAYHRKLTIECSTYEEVLQDIKSPEVAACQTIIIDTAGSFITYLKDWAMREKKDAKQKNGEFNSLRGFGYVKSEFASFTSMLRDAMHKNVIYIFHSEEKQDRDGNAQQRLLCEGASRNSVWTSADFGAYLQMIDSKRVLCFSPTQEYFAKGCHGVEGLREVPQLAPTDRNDYLTRLFDYARANIEADNKACEIQRQEYEHTMERIRGILDGIIDVQTANEAAAAIKTMQHSLTSKQEASALLRDRTAALGLRWSSEAGGYIEAGESA